MRIVLGLGAHIGELWGKVSHLRGKVSVDPELLYPCVAYPTGVCGCYEMHVAGGYSLSRGIGR
jgi:hypothetical protein